MTGDQLRQVLTELLRLEQRPPAVPVESTEERQDGYVVERLVLDLGTPVQGVLTRPLTPGPHPAVLYCHAHGGQHAIGRHELLDGRGGLVGAYGPVLARAGFVTLCIDLRCFGARSDEKESAAAKALIWRGDSLWACMLRDLAAALDYLAARPDVDPTRIATLGLSMGALQAFWLAALDQRIARAAHLCCFADIETLVDLGAHDRHNFYLLVPGLLNLCRTGQIAALIAPRPQLITIGGQDALTPEPALRRALADLRPAYGDSDALQLLVVPDVGHQETEGMRAAVMEFLGEM